MLGIIVAGKMPGQREARAGEDTVMSGNICQLWARQRAAATCKANIEKDSVSSRWTFILFVSTLVCLLKESIIWTNSILLRSVVVTIFAELNYCEDQFQSYYDVHHSPSRERK